MGGNLSKYGQYIGGWGLITTDCCRVVIRVSSRSRARATTIDAFAYVLRAVLANSPNSVPPERVFSVLNDTFEADMDRSHADYIELSLQLQYNGRSRGE